MLRNDLAADSRVYTADQSRQLDQLAATALGIETLELMRRAGRSAFEFLSERWPEAKRLLVVCGKGNNAGDGYVVAQLARDAGYTVAVWQVGDAPTQGDAVAAIADAKAGGVEVAVGERPAGKWDVLVDALLGTGLTGDLREPFESAVASINGLSDQQGSAVLALDLPSGVHCDTGATAGAAVRADATIAFLGNKRGVATGKGKDLAGELVIDDLGFARGRRGPSVDGVVARRVRWHHQRLPTRSSAAWKTQVGHVAIVGGDTGMGGAAMLAGEAALRTGAGLVSVLTRAEHASAMLARRPELMVASDIASVLERASVLVVGPGLGRRSWGRRLFEYAKATDLPSVFDADGLVWLADFAHRYGAPEHAAPWLLTPHPGEAATLLGQSIAEVEADRFTAAASLAERYQAHVVLKGPGSVLASPDAPPVVCAHGNPGMASGGMGDVLAGVAGALLGQAIDRPGAMLAAAMTAHSAAADLAALETGSHGLIASDVIDALPRLMRRSLRAG